MGPRWCPRDLGVLSTCPSSSPAPGVRGPNATPLRLSSILGAMEFLPRVHHASLHWLTLFGCFAYLVPPPYARPKSEAPSLCWDLPESVKGDLEIWETTLHFQWLTER